jgi:hypothetical protein
MAGDGAGEEGAPRPRPEPPASPPARARVGAAASARLRPGLLLRGAPLRCVGHASPCVAVRMVGSIEFGWLVWLVWVALSRSRLPLSVCLSLFRGVVGKGETPPTAAESSARLFAETGLAHGPSSATSLSGLFQADSRKEEGAMEDGRSARVKGKKVFV